MKIIDPGEYNFSKIKIKVEKYEKLNTLIEN